MEKFNSISGIFNIAYGNYTVGEVADLVKEGVREHLGIEARLNIMHATDFRNYKVNIEKARKVLSFNARYDVKDIIKNLAENIQKFKDMENVEYYNIKIFKNLDAARRGAN